MASFSRLATIVFTLRHMRPRQVVWFFLRRVLKLRNSTVRAPAVLPGSTAVGSIGVQTDFLTPATEQDLKDGVSFLNRWRDFPVGAVDWRSADMPKLWRYNLHYFDYLLWPRVDDPRKAALIDDWIDTNPQGAEDAWEPYTVSLRLVNWIEWFLQPARRGALAPAWLESLATQAAWLMNNVEYHILANHYLKNGKALFFAGIFFDGPDAERWLNKGLKILRSEAYEQFLGDGAHYELSPMYHNLCTQDYLDVLNLALGNGERVSAADAELFRETGRRALDFATSIAFPDGDIPLFNDSALRIAPNAATLADYGRALFGYAPPARPERRLIRCDDAGYFGAAGGGTQWLVDCGAIRPTYQPGHTHCDLLSFELAVAGRRVVVDSGVYDYEDSEFRRYARSTRAHNTLALEGAEQSEIWGVFRVARRARPLSADIEEVSGGALFRGEYIGFPALGQAVRHRREIDFRWSGTLTVRDFVTGAAGRSAATCLHLHPDLTPERQDQGVRVRTADDATVLEVIPGENVGIQLETGWYFPEFGVKRHNAVLIFRALDAGFAELAYTLKLAGSTHPD